MSSYRWITTEVPNDLPIRQVYGFIFAPDGRLLVLEDRGIFTLPGGRPENDESMEETLVRESLEEGQVEIDSMEFLGYQRVDGDEPFAQVRFIAMLASVLDSALDPSTGRQYQRVWVSPQNANEFLEWGDSGDQQIASAVAAMAKVGVPIDAELIE